MMFLTPTKTVAIEATSFLVFLDLPSDTLGKIVYAFSHSS
jgi:hypothetical protein